ncbi:MAG: sensor histidine kinase [Eggerthellaceae bacterium]|nr:sensor histidine kinase [Eggerthellaceae bacterium]
METNSLQEFVETVNGTGHLRVEYDYGDGFVRLQTSEAERRQAAQDIQCSEHIVLELLRNSRDAHASHIFVAMSRLESNRVLTVIDDGDGIPKSMHQHVFEPRVTSKLDSSHKDAWGLHGRGMALYSIKVNAESASVVCSSPKLGTSICVVSDTAKLSERTDQSTFPEFELAEPGKVNVRGPRNLLRTICEFAIECRSSCDVFVGSPAEICAALYQYGLATLSTVERLFCSDVEGLVVTKRLATASDPRQFASIAASLGLEISERTARRIIDGEIASPGPILERITLKSSGPAAKRKNSAKSTHIVRNVHLDADDRELLAKSALSSFRAIADKYYLEPDVQAQVRAIGGRIVISLPVVDRE